jgi:hypothetical protein
MRRFLIAFALLTSGCDLYFNGGDDECKPIAEPAFVPNEYRDPNTGECQLFGGGCDPHCDPNCAPTAEDVAFPDWGSCYSQCEGLAANQCMATPGCFAAFYDWPTQDRKPEFRACFQTAPSGPVAGACTNLDAQQCSRHDNCIAFYEGPETTRTSPIRQTFLSCAAEPISSTCAAADCGPGTHCEDQCNANGQCQAVCEPDVDVCAAVDCGPGWACTQVCTGGSCGAQCVPNGTCEAITTENACKTRPDCTTVFLGDDCTCTPAGGCHCEILTYDHCETN